MPRYEEVTEEQEVTFCGFEIAKKNEVYTFHQQKYVGEWLQRRQVQGRENHPLPKIVEDCNEEWKDLGSSRNVRRSLENFRTSMAGNSYST